VREVDLADDLRPAVQRLPRRGPVLDTQSRPARRSHRGEATTRLVPEIWPRAVDLAASEQRLVREWPVVHRVPSAGEIDHRSAAVVDGEPPRRFRRAPRSWAQSAYDRVGAASPVPSISTRPDRNRDSATTISPGPSTITLVSTRPMWPIATSDDDKRHPSEAARSGARVSPGSTVVREVRPTRSDGAACVAAGGTCAQGLGGGGRWPGADAARRRC
jgi:hypothetical protein